MWLLNLNKKVNITLNKTDYLAWEIIKWNVNFEFWLDKLDMNKIFVIFRKKIITEIKTYRNWSYSYDRNTKYTTISEKILKEKWEYKNESLDFEFKIPNNIIPQISTFDKKLKDILKKLKIKWIFANIIELIFSYLIVSRWAKVPTFEIEARLDIPWWKDITTKKQIEIWESKDNLNN